MAVHVARGVRNSNVTRLPFILHPVRLLRTVIMGLHQSLHFCGPTYIRTNLIIVLASWCAECDKKRYVKPVAYPGILWGGGGSTNSIENRENGDLGAVAP